MAEYYTSIELLCAAALVILMILIHENGRLEKSRKKWFYLTYTVIILAMGAEWLSLYLNGASENTIILHNLSKGLDYILTPVAGVLFIHQISSNRFLKKITWVILIINGFIQVTSMFTGWIFYIDENNYYKYGKGHQAYILLYFALIVIVGMEFLIYSRNYKKRNRAALYSIMIMTMVGVGIQEFVGENTRTAYLALTLGSILLFIYYTEFSLQESDEELVRQQEMLETDPLTGLKSRHAFSIAVTELGKVQPLPEDLVVFLLDIDGLKRINDSLGHSVGDEAICGAAECISGTFWMYGDCYRIGGDEFLVILEAERKQVSELRRTLDQMVESWAGWSIDRIHISYGWTRAAEYPDAPIDELINIADKRMYDRKADYYKNLGIDPADRR